jgi:outer membrane lipoprotein carrier protein
VIPTHAALAEDSQPVAPATPAAEALATTTAPSSVACSADLAERVQRHYDSVSDFTAEFEQTTRSALFGSSGLAGAEAARGEVILAKPGKMRWTYTHPEESLVISDGTTLWLYSPQLAEAQHLPMTKGYLTGAALSFLLGEGRLLETFRVSARNCGQGSEIVELELEPLEPASYERLGLTVVEASGEVVATSVFDLFGNETRIGFERVQRNQNPPQTIFEFEPGPGISVIELEGS